MEAVIQRTSFENSWDFLVSALWGCGLIAFCSLVKIPFYPIPFTLHTFAISLLALTQSSRQAMASVLCYLACGTLGLPVFSGHASPLWIMGKSAGYFIAFPLAAYLSSKLSQKIPPFLALLCGQTLIHLLGSLWLIPLVGVSTAWMKGFLIFIPGDVFKNLLAAGLVARWRRSWQRS